MGTPPGGGGWVLVKHDEAPSRARIARRDEMLGNSAFSGKGTREQGHRDQQQDR